MLRGERGERREDKREDEKEGEPEVKRTDTKKQKHTQKEKRGSKRGRREKMETTKKSFHESNNIRAVNLNEGNFFIFSSKSSMNDMLPLCSCVWLLERREG